jgi:hypothetical protein
MSAAKHTPVSIGQHLARQIFQKRGNHSEAHLSELELAAIIVIGIERAAAPDMAEALRSVTDDAEGWLDYAVANDRIVQRDIKPYRDHIANARAALAKAGL